MTTPHWWGCSKGAWCRVSTHCGFTGMGVFTRGVQAPALAPTFSFSRLFLILNTEHTATRAGRGLGPCCNICQYSLLLSRSLTLFSRFHTLGESDCLQINSRLSHICPLLLRAALASGAYHIHSKPLTLALNAFPNGCQNHHFLFSSLTDPATHTLSCSQRDDCCFSVPSTLLPLPPGSRHFS